MARFFFHFRQLSALTVDEEGSEFETVEDAYLSAFRAMQKMWHEMLLERQDPRSCSFDVTDSEGNLLFNLPFTEILDACCANQDDRPMYYAQLLLSALNNQHRLQRLRGEPSAEVNAARNSLAESLSLLSQLKKKVDRDPRENPLK